MLFPRSPGVGSTFGLLSTDIRSDLGQSVLIGMDDPTCVAKIGELYRMLADRAWKNLAREGVPEGRRELLVSADFRYRRQQYTVNVEVAREPGTSWDSPPTREELLRAVDDFHAAHRKLCGFDYRDDQSMGVDLINIRIAAIGRLSHPRLAEIGARNGRAAETVKSIRPVYFEEEGGFVDTPIVDRARLQADDAVDGPAVIEEFDSTTVVLPHQRAIVDRYGNIILAVAAH